MGSIDELAELFRRFPGIGPRQARRFVYHLLREQSGARRKLAERIQALDAAIATCMRCGRFFELKKGHSHSSHHHPGQSAASAQDSMCTICSNTERGHTLMIVERDADLEKMEKTHSYDGHYFILGGTLTFGDEEGHTKIRIRELETLIADTPHLKEIIIALNPTPEGDYTASHLREVLSTYKDARPDVIISTLARGLAAGVELEYADQETLKSALTRRH